MGKRLSMGDEMQNIRALSDFRGYWSESPEYPDENFGNIQVHFPVSVHYMWANGRSKMRFNSEFRAYIGSGPSDGVIDIDDSPKASINDYHLRFQPAFQNYRYDEATHALVITDSSDKMGGKYEVQITPTIAAP